MAQKVNELPFPAQEDPLFFVDSVESTQGMAGLSPDKIALINVVKGAGLEARYGPRAASGVIYIETKPFAHRRYNNMFSELSPAYAQTLKQFGSDSSFQYIMDSTVLTDNIESMLAALERKNIAGIDILNKDALNKQFNIQDKRTGVVIRSKTE